MIVVAKPANEPLSVPLPDSVANLARMICGCGSPDMAWEAIRDCLRAQADFHDGKMAELKWPQTGAEWFLAYALDSLGYTEHGGNVGGAWLTDAGRELLAFFECWGVDWQSSSVQFVDSEGSSYGDFH